MIDGFRNPGSVALGKHLAALAASSTGKYQWIGFYKGRSR
jgi:putative methionine-R-sulfoxide reductase with GAF domain